MKQTRISKLLAALAVAVGLGASANANAVIQLGFIIDESGSVGAANYGIIKNGLATAINTLIPVDGSYELSVVSFSSSAQVLVGHVLIDSAATRTGVANSILADSYSGGTTAMDAAFYVMRNILATSTQSIDATYVNFATDGVPTTTSRAVAAAARNALIANASVDNLSVEGIGSGVDKPWLMNSICYPGPCDDTAPYSFPTNGFYIGVADAQGYADAIGNKIRVVTHRTPEPGTLALLGLGFAGLALRKRRR